MKLTFILVVFAVSAIFSNTMGQTSEINSMTYTERCEVVEFANKVSKELSAKKDVNSLANWFVDDFVARHINDPDNYALGLVDIELAKKLSSKELLEYYFLAATFEYLEANYFATRFYFGKTKTNDDSQNNKQYPPGVYAIKKKWFLSSTDITIKDYRQFHDQISDLKTGVKIFKDYFSKTSVESSNVFKENLEYMSLRERHFAPSSSVFNESTFGFPKGTRGYLVNIPFFQLSIVRVDGQLKIVNLGSD